MNSQRFGINSLLNNIKYNLISLLSGDFENLGGIVNLNYSRKTIRAMKMSYVFLPLIFALTPILLSGQCTTGSEVECTCETAEILCSVVELDGYSNALADYQHPQDGPDPLCGGGTVPNNPNWFGFIAWCEDISMTVDLSNCNTVSGFSGAQAGVYEDCNNMDVVDCASECNNGSQINLDLQGLVIGQVYYFMIDGCLGSTCDYTISVSPTTCDEEIEDWTNDITGEIEACEGDDITYDVDDLDGATTYHWYVDGNEESTTDEPTETITWTSAGTYELCVDVSNECIDVGEDPMEICTTVVVSAVDAGTITATPDPLCPTETSDVTVTGYNQDPGVTEVIIIVDPNGEVLDVITGSSTTSVTYDMCGDITVYSLNYADFENINIPSIGGTYTGTDCSDACCDEVSEDISFDDDTDPEFTSPPSDETLVCIDGVMPMPDLECTDNCGPTKMIMGMETNDADMCNGGTITREWMCVDTCGNETMHLQTITIDPTIPPDFVNPPGDVTIICSGMVPDPIDLMYTNGGSGACLIEGMVSPVVNGTADICGSIITYEWDFTDVCGNNINHIQTITIEPADEPAFIGAPPSVVISCDDQVPPPIDLDYSNNDSGSCLISGTISPVVNGTYDACGTIITYEWDFTDPCGVNINHVQTIEIEPSEEPSFINPPSDMTMTCPDYDAFSFANLDYANTNSSPCDISGTVMPTINDNTNECGGVVEAFYTYTDDCGRTIDHTQTITIDPPEQADFINPPVDMTVSCDAIPAAAGPLDYTNNEVPFCLIAGSVDPVIDEDYTPCGGTITNTWEYIDDCGRVTTETQTITIEPTTEPMFTQSPPDLTMTCEEFNDFTPQNLPYTNGESGFCLISGSISPTSNGTISNCGGVITYIWEYTDDCGRFIQETQQVTVSPAPQAFFTTTPVDMTLDCSEVNEAIPDLAYTNGEDGICLIAGTVQGIPSGLVDDCGGILDVTWTFQDNCGRVITETQQLTYLPADEPEFIDPPEDITVDCADEVMDPEVLEYDNELDAPCQIAGDVTADINIVDNIYEYTWSFTNECTGNTIEHTQVVTKLLPLEWEQDQFEYIICQGLEFDLSTVPVIDIYGTSPEITFHDEIPHDSGNEIDPEIDVELPGGIYYIVGTNEFGCFDVAEVEIIPDEEVYAGDDIEDDFCVGTELLDLFSVLTFNADLDGEFTLESGQDLDIIDPSAVNVSEAEPGIYIFTYYVQSDGTCPDDEAEILIEIFEAVQIDLISIECAADGLSYTVVITNDDYEIDVSDGDITEETSSQVTISNIPIGTPLTIEALDEFTRCRDEVTFNSPNCSCPTVPAPVSNGNETICQGDLNPVLSVTVGPDAMANWYDSPTGGMIIAFGTTDYQPTPTTPGIYTYYVEAESTIQAGCVSANRTTVTFEIVPLPAVRDTFINICDVDNDGFISITREEIDPIVSFGLSNLTINYYDDSGNIGNVADTMTFPFVNDSLIHQVIYAEIINSADCKMVIDFDIIINPSPELSAMVTNEICLMDNNGQISFEVNMGQPPFTLIYQGDTLSDNTLDMLAPGMYNVIVIDSFTCRDTLSSEVLPGITLEFSSLTFICDDNGTNTDSTDDSYTIDFLVAQSTGDMGQFDLSSDAGGYIGTYAYGQTHTITWPADGSQITLTASDATSGCEVQAMAGPFVPCSSECSLTIDILELTCSDNGTDLDPTDDYYDVSINVSAINGGSNNTYNVLLDNVVSYSYQYGVLNTFQINANGQTINIQVVDSQINGCFESDVLANLVSCSDACLLETDIISITCDNNGTEATSDDDTFNPVIQVEGFNVMGGFSIPSLGISGNYNEDVDLGVFPIAGGDLSIIIIDDNDNSCQDTIDITAPQPCSDPCDLDMAYFNILACNDNGTPQDPTDDYFGVNFLISVIDGNTSNIVVEDDQGNNYGSFNYDEDIIISNLPADNTVINFIFTDPVNGTCLIEQSAQSPSCSDLCSIDLTLIDIICDDAGTMGDNDDDTYSAQVMVNGTNTGTDFTVTNTGEIASYGSVITISNQLILDGDILLQITDNDDPTCLAELLLEAPEACSQPCTLSFNTFDVGPCDDNGTPTEPGDDFFSVDINVTATEGVVSQYTIEDNNGTTYGPYNYDEDIQIGPFPADGVVYTFSITDPANGSCLLEQTASSNSCSGLCIIDAVVSNISCDDNGTVEDNSDDTFSATLEVSGVNQSTGFEIQPIGVNGNYDDQLQLPAFPISGGDVQLIIIDNDDVTCTDTIQITAPEPCSEPCTIDFAFFDVSACDDNSSGTDPTDDFFSINLNITAVDGVVSQFIIEDSNMMTYGPFDYDQDIEIGPFTADGTIYTFTITDLTNGTCLLSQTASSESCSDMCVINAQINAITCDDNGTLATNDDDTFTAIIEVTGINQSTGIEILPLGLAANYNEAIQLPVFNISDGDVEIIIIDNMNGLCTDTLLLQAPGPCSQPCDINISQLNILNCDDNGTGNDASDDFYFIEISIEGVSGFGTSYNITDQFGTDYGDFTYDQIQQIGPFAADGTNYNLMISDPTNGSCVLNTSVVNDACSSCNQTASIDAATLVLDCETTESMLTVNTSDVPVSYNWTAPDNTTSGDPELTATLEGTYSLLIIYPDGCEVTDQVSITLNDDMPVADAGPDQIINCDIQSAVLDASASQITSNTVIEWIDASGNVVSNDISYETDQPGIYMLALTDTLSNCQAQSDMVEVADNFNMPSSIIYANPGNILDCSIQSVILSADEEPNTIYNWYIGSVIVSSDASFTVTEPAIVNLIAIDTISSCESTSDIELLDLTAYPVIDFGPVQEIDCEFAEVCVEVTSIGSAENIEFLWLDENGNTVSTMPGQFCTNQAGSYTIELTDTENGCVNEESFFIDGPVVGNVNLPQIINLEVGDTPVLNPQINIPEGDIMTIEWVTNAVLSCTDCLNPTVLSYTDGELITLNITTVTGCEDSASTILDLRDEPAIRIYIPNVFSPENRSNFTIFTDESIDLIQNMYIYDRWGELIFTNENFAPNDPDLGWDGYFNDGRAEPGVYVYLFIFEWNGVVQTWVGDVTLLW